MSICENIKMKETSMKISSIYFSLSINVKRANDFNNSYLNGSVGTCSSFPALNSTFDGKLK